MKSLYVVVNEFGAPVQVTQTMTPPDGAIEAPDVESMIEVHERGFVWSGVAWIECGPRPSPFHELRGEALGWVPNLEAARQARRADVEREVSTRIYAPVTYDGAEFDADEMAQRRISRLCARIERGSGLTAGWVGWRASDNSQKWAAAPDALVLLNLNGLRELLEDREQAILVCAWTHKAALEALQTIEEIQAYDITVGWP